MTSRCRFPIVTYHSIDDLGTRISVSAGRFTRQMHWFHDHGWTTLSLREAMRAIGTGQSIPPGKFALTFDDGMESLLIHAAPLLKKLGFTATTFVVTGQVGSNPHWYRIPDAYRQTPLLDIGGLKALIDLGWEVHPHTHDHPVLPHLPLKKQIEQVRRSRELIQQWFDAPGDVLAYPFGQINDDTGRAMKACDMLAGLTLQFGTLHNADDPFNRPRVGSAWFKDSAFRQRAAMNGWMDGYVALRTRWRGDRSRHFTTPNEITTCGLLDADGS